MLRGQESVRALGPSDVPAFRRLTGRDPVVNVFAAYRAATTHLDPRWLGGAVWGRFVDGDLVSACHLGANLVPVGCGPDDVAAFAAPAAGRASATATIVGPEEQVAGLWSALSPTWPAAREERWAQPHLEISRRPAVEADPEVRLTTRADLEALYPACVAMYTEEVGVSPEQTSGDHYRARVLQLVSRGWSFARFDETGRVLFKAEVGCATPEAAQVQGVYVAPERRGEGLATRGMAAVVELVRRSVAPTVSLYVNEWNAPARAAYARVGFEETARFATVMF